MPGADQNLTHYMRMVMQYNVPNIPLRYAQDMPKIFFISGRTHTYISKRYWDYISYIYYMAGVSCRSVMMLKNFLLITLNTCIILVSPCVLVRARSSFVV